MRMSSDDRGLESLPLRLLIVAAVAAMSIAPAAGALEALQDRDFMSRAGLTMDKVVHTAQMLSMQGPGAAATIGLDLSSDGGLGMARLAIGDAPGGAYASAVVLELSSGARIVRLAQDPPACMTSAAWQCLEVGSSRFSLRMETLLSEDGCMVVVEAV